MTAEHTPSLPATSHASHWPPHAELQHTPSTQKPEPHSDAVLHDSPACFRGTHTPPEQYSPRVLQVPTQPSAQMGFSESQPEGQSRCSARGQLPEPSQKAATVA